MSSPIKRIDLCFNFTKLDPRFTCKLTKPERERRKVKYTIRNSFFQNELSKDSYYRTINNGQPFRFRKIEKNSLPILSGPQSPTHSKRFINLLNIKKNPFNDCIFKRSYSCEFLDSFIRKTNKQFYPSQYRSEKMLKWEGLNSNNENKNFVLSSKINRDYHKLKLNLLDKGKSAVKIITNKFIQQKIKIRKIKHTSGETL